MLPVKELFICEQMLSGNLCFVMQNVTKKIFFKSLCGDMEKDGDESKNEQVPKGTGGGVFGSARD